jgi:hypothetical protein
MQIINSLNRKEVLRRTKPVRISEHVHRDLKIMSANDGGTMGELIEQALSLQYGEGLIHKIDSETTGADNPKNI